MTELEQAIDHLSGFAYNGCFTGDCPHNTAQECLDALQGQAGEAMTFLENRVAQGLADTFATCAPVAAPASPPPPAGGADAPASPPPQEDK